MYDWCSCIKWLLHWKWKKKKIVTVAGLSDDVCGKVVMIILLSVIKCAIKFYNSFYLQSHEDKLLYKLTLWPSVGDSVKFILFEGGNKNL